ncbi:MAG TPA: co-chaperone GroES [Sulfurovum sp. UBA12169]|nr:MAG TPA: co-chaperone GroES [Sulfurovum sp. UBA12169]
MNFKPLGKRVLIKREEEQKTTASGIILPDNAKEKPLQGTVIALAEKAAKKGIKEGDKVIFGKFKGTEITMDGQELLILESDDILGILN